MSGTDNTAPVTANLQTGEVSADVSAPLNKPSPKTVSIVWLGIVGGMITVMVASAGGLVWGMFLPDVASLVKPEAVLILFTGSSAFLAGLIARDPGQHH